MAAVEKGPNDLALRLHLASLLLEESQATQALDHLAVVLRERPDDIEALRLAARAADSTGQIERASAYRRILDALTQDDLSQPHSSGNQSAAEDVML